MFQIQIHIQIHVLNVKESKQDSHRCVSFVIGCMRTSPSIQRHPVSSNGVPDRLALSIMTA
jgi:hypothetical protein